jgi:hypothetical protein
MTEPQDSFWAALREAFLEWAIGSQQLDAWRAERKQREECDKAYRAMMENIR